MADISVVTYMYTIRYIENWHWKGWFESSARSLRCFDN